jgi:hypothetical protein
MFTQVRGRAASARCHLPHTGASSFSAYWSMGRGKLAALRKLADERGRLDAQAPLPEEAEIAAALGTPKQAASTVSTLASHRGRIAGWFDQGMSGTTIPGALRPYHTYTGSLLHPWPALPRGPDARAAAPDRRRHQRQPRAVGAARRLSRHLPFGRRCRRRLARPARPRHQHAGRRAHRRAPHHRRVRRA